MPWFKPLTDRLEKKRRDLERQAAEKVARATLERGTQAARDALQSAGKAVEAALFGDGGGAAVAKSEGAAPAKPPGALAKEAAADAARRREAVKEAHARELQRADDRARVEESRDAEIDAELAAWKKKLGK